MLFVCFSAVAVGQTWLNVIYLKDGTVVRGNIVGIYDSHISVEIGDDQIVDFNIGDIARMEEELDPDTPRDLYLFITSQKPVLKKWNIGVTAGYLYSGSGWTLRSSDGVRYGRNEFIKWTHGFTAGAVGQYRPVMGWSVDFGAKVSKSGFVYDQPYFGKMDFSRISLDFPVGYTMYSGRRMNWYLSAGLNLGVTVGGSAWIDVFREPSKLTFKASEAYKNACIGYFVTFGYNGFYVEFSNNLTNTWKHDFNVILDNLLYEDPGVETMSNRYIGVSVGYTFRF